MIARLILMNIFINTCFLFAQEKDIAFRVFELGMKKFSGDVGFMLAYINFLSHLNGEKCVKINEINEINDPFS